MDWTVPRRRYRSGCISTGCFWWCRCPAGSGGSVLSFIRTTNSEGWPRSRGWRRGPDGSCRLLPIGTPPRLAIVASGKARLGCMVQSSVDGQDVSQKKLRRRRTIVPASSEDNRFDHVQNEESWRPAGVSGTREFSPIRQPIGAGKRRGIVYAGTEPSAIFRSRMPAPLARP